MVGDGPSGLPFGDLPGDPDLALVPVGAHLSPDDIVPPAVGLAHVLEDPAGPFVEIKARMREREDEAALGSEEPGRFSDRTLAIRHVLDRHVGDNEVERGIRQVGEVGRVPLEEPGPRTSRRFASPSERERRPGSVDAEGHARSLSRPAAGEVAVPAPEVEDAPAPHRADDVEQRRIDDRAVPEVAAFPHPKVPPGSEVVPAFARHDRAERTGPRKEGGLGVPLLRGGRATAVRVEGGSVTATWFDRRALDAGAVRRTPDRGGGMYERPSARPPSSALVPGPAERRRRGRSTEA